MGKNERAGNIVGLGAKENLVARIVSVKFDDKTPVEKVLARGQLAPEEINARKYQCGFSAEEKQFMRDNAKTLELINCEALMNFIGLEYKGKGKEKSDSDEKIIIAKIKDTILLFSAITGETSHFSEYTARRDAKNLYKLCYTDKTEKGKEIISQRARKLIVAHTAVDKTQPLHDFCLFSIPDGLNWNPEWWYNLITKRAKGSGKVMTLLGRADKIEEELKGRVPITYEEGLDALKRLSYQRNLEVRELPDDFLAGGIASKDAEGKEILTGGVTKHDLEKYTELCVRFAITERDYNKGLNLLLGGEFGTEPMYILSGQKLKTEEELPGIVIDGANLKVDDKALQKSIGKYYMVKLPPHDYRALLLGKLTNCCQSIGGQGQDCAVTGMSDPKKGFYVIMEKGKDGSQHPKTDRIIAQAYTWLGETKEGRKTITWDSWERLGHDTDKLFSPFASAFALEAREHGIDKMTVGWGNTPRDRRLPSLKLVNLPREKSFDSSVKAAPNTIILGLEGGKVFVRSYVGMDLRNTHELPEETAEAAIKADLLKWIKIQKERSLTKEEQKTILKMVELLIGNLDIIESLSPFLTTSDKTTFAGKYLGYSDSQEGMQNLIMDAENGIIPSEEMQKIVLSLKTGDYEYLKQQKLSPNIIGSCLSYAAETGNTDALRAFFQTFPDIPREIQQKSFDSVFLKSATYRLRDIGQDERVLWGIRMLAAGFDLDPDDVSKTLKKSPSGYVEREAYHFSRVKIDAMCNAVKNNVFSWEEIVDASWIAVSKASFLTEPHVLSELAKGDAANISIEEIKLLPGDIADKFSTTTGMNRYRPASEDFKGVMEGIGKGLFGLEDLTKANITFLSQPYFQDELAKGDDARIKMADLHENEGGIRNNVINALARDQETYENFLKGVKDGVFTWSDFNKASEEFAKGVKDGVFTWRDFHKVPDERAVPLLCAQPAVQQALSEKRIVLDDIRNLDTGHSIIMDMLYDRDFKGDFQEVFTGIVNGIEQKLFTFEDLKEIDEEEVILLSKENIQKWVLEDKERLKDVRFLGRNIKILTLIDTIAYEEAKAILDLPPVQLVHAAYQRLHQDAPYDVKRSTFEILIRNVGKEELSETDAKAIEESLTLMIQDERFLEECALDYNLSDILKYAIEKGHLQLLRPLLEKAEKLIDPKKQVGLVNMRLLEKAASAGTVEDIKMLCDISEYSEYDLSSALEKASDNGNTEMFQSILTVSKGKIEWYHMKGSFEKAVKKDQTDTIKLYCDALSTDEKKKAFRSYTIEYKPNIDVAKILWKEIKPELSTEEMITYGNMLISDGDKDLLRFVLSEIKDDISSEQKGGILGMALAGYGTSKRNVRTILEVFAGDIDPKDLGYAKDKIHDEPEIEALLDKQIEAWNEGRNASKMSKDAAMAELKGLKKAQDRNALQHLEGVAKAIAATVVKNITNPTKEGTKKLEGNIHEALEARYGSDMEGMRIDLGLKSFTDLEKPTVLVVNKKIQSLGKQVASELLQPSKAESRDKGGVTIDLSTIPDLKNLFSRGNGQVAQR